MGALVTVMMMMMMTTMMRMCGNQLVMVGIEAARFDGASIESR